MALFGFPGGDRMPPKLVPEDLAAYWTGRPASTIRRWAVEGRLTRHWDRSDRINGVRYDLDELPEATRDTDTLELLQRAPTPPVITNPAANSRGHHTRPHAA